MLEKSLTLHASRKLFRMQIGAFSSSKEELLISVEVLARLDAGILILLIPLAPQEAIHFDSIVLRDPISAFICLCSSMSDAGQAHQRLQTGMPDIPRYSNKLPSG